MGKIKNQFYKEFLDGFLINEINREDIKTVLQNLKHRYQEQAEVLIIIAWATGARPNEYLRLTPEHFSRSTEFIEIKFPGSKGSSARTISLPRYTINKNIDPFTNKVHEYTRKLFPKQYLFWFFRSESIQNGVTKKYKKKDGEIITKHYNKIYNKLAGKLNYYFPKWFNCIFPDGIPPYYLRHNRATRVLEKAGREATIETFGWKTEHTLKKYVHKTKKMRQEIGKALME